MSGEQDQNSPKRTKATTTVGTLSGKPSQLRRAGMFKVYLSIGAVVLALALFLSTHYIVNEVRESSRSHLELSVSYYRSLLQGDNPGLAYEAVQGITFPIVLTDENNNPKFWKNVPVEPGDTSLEAFEKVRKLVDEMDKLGHHPVPLEVIPGIVDYFHFGDPAIVRMLRWFTFTTLFSHLPDL